MPRISVLFAATISAFTILTSPSAGAQQSKQSVAEVQAQSAMLVQAQSNESVKPSEQALRTRDQMIIDLQKRVEVLEREIARLQPRSTAASIGSTGSTSTQAALPVAPVRNAPSDKYDEEERTARAALDRTLVSRGGILLPRWTVEVENAFTYYNASSDAISIDGFSILPVLVVGDIVSQRVRRDIMRATITNRLGLPGDFQFEVRLPYGYELERTVTADNKQTSKKTLGIGDLEVGLIKQVHRQSGSWPDLLVSARWKGTTGRDPFEIGKSLQPALGTGFHSVQGSLIAVKSSDPAVFFGGLSYTANLHSDKGVAGLNPDHPELITVGHINPGDTIGFNLGSALALNPDASLSFAWEQRFTRTSSLNGKRIPGSFLSEGMLRIGTSYLYSPGRTLDVGIGIGLTRDTPDFQFSIAFPFRFSLRRTPRLVGTGPSEKLKPELATVAAQSAVQKPQQ